jgi:hypothetical protein
MLVAPTDNNPFKWSDIHSLAKAKLQTLDRAIREEIRMPLPLNGGARHQFFVLLSERVDDWANRAKTGYLDCLAQVGRQPSQPITLSIWENGLKFFITENLREYMILACGISAKELDWAENGSPGVRGTPQVKAVISTLHEIDRITKSVLSRFEFSMSQSGNWLADTRKLLNSLPASERQDEGFVTGRAPISQVMDKALQSTVALPRGKTDMANKGSIPSESADDALWQQLSSDFSMLASEEKSANALPLGAMAASESNRSSDLTEWELHNGCSENFKARFELLASQAGKALGPLPVGASPFCYWLHRLYQDLQENRSKFIRRSIIASSLSGEGPLIDSVCEASSTFCLRLQKCALERDYKRRTLSACFEEWIENNFVSETIPAQISGRNRVSLLARSARTSIPIEFLSSRLQEIGPPRGSTEFGSPRSFFDRIAEKHGLIWAITRGGLWMAHQPPSSGAYIDAQGRPHRTDVEPKDATSPSLPREQVVPTSELLKGPTADSEKSESGEINQAHSIPPIEQGGIPDFSVSADCRSVVFGGQQHSLTRSQALMMKILVERHEGRHPVVDKDTLLSAVESETSTVRDFWKGSPLWKTLIISKKKGTYQLNPWREHKA